MSYPNSKEEHGYNQMCNHAYQHEQFIMSKANEYGLFCIECYRKKLPLLTFDDFLKLKGNEQK